MASIRKRGNSYLLVVSMGYDHTGKRRAAETDKSKYWNAALRVHG